MSFRNEILLGNHETSIVLEMETSSQLTVGNFAFAAPGTCIRLVKYARFAD